MQTPTFSRRDGRRFVHVTLRVADVGQLDRLAPFAWSRYRFAREGDALGVPSDGRARRPGRRSANAGGPGKERVAFRMHIPSRVLFENATTDVQRGNIVAWVQPLADRLAGVPIDLEVRMESAVDPSQHAAAVWRDRRCGGDHLRRRHLVGGAAGAGRRA